jgi:hypothetical protein
MTILRCTSDFPVWQLALFAAFWLALVAGVVNHKRRDRAVASDINLGRPSVEFPAR